MEKLNKLRDLIRGRKTYIISGLMALISLINFLAGDMTFIEFIQDPYLLAALGLSSLRAGIDNTLIK